jgi:hypothetical protein
MVMSFREMYSHLQWLQEKNKDMSSHPNGTYMSAKLSRKSQKLLDKWVSVHNIPNAADPKQYHSTIIYSRKGVPDVKEYDVKLPIKAKVKEWKIFPTQTGAKALVAIMDSPELDNHHKTIREKYGATHDYPDFHAHVTVSYDYGNGPAPKDIPDLELEYDSTELKPLDPTFVPPKKN